MKINNRQKGFTLIEVLIALTIFVILMTVVSSSYLNIARSQREANAIREIYSEVRYLFNLIGEQAREKTIDYGCPRTIELNEDDITRPIDQGSTSTVCSDLFILQNENYLALVNRTSSERVIFKLNDIDGDKKMMMYREAKEQNGSAWSPEPGYEQGFVEIELNGINIKDIKFEKAPLEDPFDPKNVSCGLIQIQPSVTIYASIEAEKESVSTFSFDLQTSFSSRVYNQQTNNL